MTIEIVVRDTDGEVLAKRTSIDSFESAEENFGKLKEWWSNKKEEKEQE